MAHRKDILNQLKQDLDDKLTVANGFESDLMQVVHGSPDMNDMMVFPIVGFMVDSDEVDTEYQGTNTRLRDLFITVYGIQEVSMEDTESYYDLMNDVENFFMSDYWTYKTTTTLGNMATFYGGVNDNKAYFILEIVVKYEQSF